MTTKHSPARALRSQAEMIADTICKAERGEPVSAQFAEKLAEARGKDKLSIAIIMDDKIVSIHLPWSVIKSTGRAGLAEFIFDQMRETRRAIN